MHSFEITTKLKKRHLSAFSLVIFILFHASAPALDQFIFSTAVTEIAMDEVGNADIVTTNSPEKTADYQALKSQYPNPQAFARYLDRTSVRAVLTDINVSYMDEARTMRITAKRLGAASRKRKQWEVYFDLPYSMIHSGGRTAILVYNVLTPPNRVNTDLMKITLPASAGDVKYDPTKRILSYRLDTPPNKEGAAEIECDFETRRNIMSGLYKVYGQPEVMSGLLWVARSVLKNTGDADITDVRIRYRVGELAPWSPDSRYDLLPAGGVIVDCYYPIFNSRAMNIDSSTPVNVEMNISYRDASGDKHEETLADLSTLLGRSDFELSFVPDSEKVQWHDAFLNAPMLAAFVTKSDPVIREFTALISRNANIGGVLDDDKTLAFCGALYGQLQANAITCRDPVGFLTESTTGIIGLKYPRDVLKERFGNSLELCALYASVCAAAGIDAGIQITPGKSAVVLRVPSGLFYQFDLSGLKPDGSLSFNEAFEAGRKAMTNQKNIIIVDVQANQKSGIVPPEMPAVPQGVLATWGVSYKEN